MGVQSVIDQKKSTGSISDKTTGFTPNGNETWIWTDLKEGLKYVVYFDSYGQVQNCLVIPLLQKLRMGVVVAHYSTSMGRL